MSHPTPARRHHCSQSGPGAGAVARRAHSPWPPCAPLAFPRVRSTRLAGPIPTTTTPGWKHGPMANGTSSAPANRSRYSTLVGSIYPPRAPYSCTPACSAITTAPRRWCCGPITSPKSTLSATTPRRVAPTSRSSTPPATPSPMRKWNSRSTTMPNITRL